MGSHRADSRAPRRRTPAAADPTPATSPRRHAAPGRRRASKHTGSRGPLFRGLPSVPVLLGVAALAISAGGAVTVSSDDITGASSGRVLAANALGGASSQSSSDLLAGRRTVSRDSRRDALADAADADLVAEAEALTRQRNAALAQFAKQAEAQSRKIALNQWVLPVSPSITTAEFGDYGLWANYHTGLDFNGHEGQEIKSVANGVVTSVGYDGSYGNKTVVTLEDGTEIWYCHQSSYGVSEGDEVRAGEVIGYIGSTGNVTGSHLHLEVRPGGGDPVDPYEAFLVHGITP
ncbi:M23 family metallopeptidase [Nocardioides coralli]|uniref:M23 family metallopeptidase n=1 Tax=Nocardioides coralli TaxID=2872154 RepID=UPI001CA3FA32|nr:M23 family metallopeptidase [Nocardioides coralli]QZY29879.1 M23 family metallopeptidase [Nocardioides coralli]